jgi:hypothetical protein
MELSSRTRQHPRQSSPVDTCDSDVEPSLHRYDSREVKVEAGRRAATGPKGRDSSSRSESSTSRERGNRRRRYSKDHRDSPSSPGRSHGRRHCRDCEYERVGHSRRRDRDSASPRSSKDRGRHRSKSAGPRHKMKPGRFDGTQSLETFLAQFATCAEYNRWSEKDKCAFLKCALSGGAAQLLWDAGDPKKLTFEQLKEKLEARYGSVGQAEKFRVELQSRRRRSGESLTDLHADIRRLMAMANPGAHGNSVCKLIARDHILTALSDRQLELKLHEREPGYLDTALRLALRLEAYASSLKRETDGRSSSPKQRRDRDRGDDRLAHRIAQIEKTSASTRQTRDEDATEWRRRYDELMKDYEKLKLLDEQRRTVTTTVDVPKAKEYARTRPAASEYRCYGCGETGHIRRSCPLEQLHRRKVDKSEGTGDSTQPSGDVVNVRGATSATKDGNSAYIRLRIQGTPVDCLLDSGAEVTIIPWSLAQGADIQPYRQQLRAANGTVIPVIGRTTLIGYANSHYLEVDGLVSKHVPNVILGLVWLKRQAAVWDFKAGSIKLGGHVFALRGSSTRSWCRRVVAQEPVVIPAFSETVLAADVIYNDLCRQSASGKAWTTEVAEPRSGLRVSRSIIPDRASDVPVRVMNVTRREIQFEAREVITELQPVTPCTTSVTAVEDSDIDKLSVLEDLVRRVDATVPRGARKALHDLLLEFRDTFSFSDNDMGRTSVLRHSIVTSDAQPVRQTLRRHPPAHQAAIKEHIATMLKQGVIEAAQSPWAANIVLVKNKDGSLCCCVDYRGLNAVTRQDAYPLPMTDACLDAMNGAQWFTTFDLRNSYHQVELEPADTDKTTFICREGSFRFLTMPFGLSNAGATFQRLMDMVTSGLNFEVCLVYLDDIIIFSRTVEQHIESLRLVLERLRSAGLKLKPAKCDIMRRSVEFLGHLVSSDGIEPHPDKVSAVTSWPEPTSLRHLRAFLGLCGYYRRFIEQFSRIAAPLYALTEKERKFVSTSDCSIAFDELKRRLTSAPILCMPTDDDPFILDTDASDSAIGAVLLPCSNGVERVVAYASKRLSKCEVNYCVTRRELLAVVYFTRYFRHFLLGRQFTVRTDHAALQWLRRIPEPDGQQARWLEILEEFDFTVIHRPGIRHGNADAMSRKPCFRARCCPRDSITSEELCLAVFGDAPPQDSAENEDVGDSWSAVFGKGSGRG